MKINKSMHIRKKGPGAGKPRNNPTFVEGVKKRYWEKQARKAQRLRAIGGLIGTAGKTINKKLLKPIIKKSEQGFTKEALIGNDWGNIHQHTKIIVKKPYKYTGIDKKEETLQPGEYYITGFWADACGLNKTNPYGLNEKVIPSAALQYFYVRK
jgi:hypothetical protein